MGFEPYNAIKLTMDFALDLKTIDWQAIAAIATFIAVAFAFYQHRAHLRKERKEELLEIVEVIVQPLRQNLKTLLFSFDESVFRTTQWWNLDNIKENDQYLFSRLPKELKEDMRQLDSKLEFFRNLSTQTLPIVREAIGKAVKTAFKDSEHQDEFGGHTPQEMAYSYYRAEVGGKHLNSYIAAFIRESMDFDKMIENFFKENQLPNKKITKEEFIVQGINIKIPGREYFIKAISEVRNAVNANKEMSEYVEKMRELYKEGQQLKAKLDWFLEKQK